MAIHIGKEIEKKYQESGLKLSEFAKRLDTGTRNVYSIFSRADINSALLLKISEVLDFDFFSLYQRRLDTTSINEPLIDYHVKKRVLLTVELDGSAENLDNWIGTLKRVNAAL